MSRRITLFVLATSAALIATQANADPECFGDSCHLPELVEPPAAAVQSLDADDAAATEASAAEQKLPAAKALAEVSAAPPVLTPQVVTPQVVTPQVVTPQVVTPQVVGSPPLIRPRVVASPQVEIAPYDSPQPLARRPLPPMPRLADEANTPREPSRLAPRHLKDAPPPLRETELPPAPYPRSVRVSSPDPSYVVGYHAPPVGGVVVVVPGVAYAAGRHPVYMIAPSAKIISIEGDD